MKDLKAIISEVADSTKKEEKKNIESIQVVVFELDGEEYAVPITDIREILNMSDITPMPNAPDFIRGILNVRGTIAVIVDLEKRFNLVREGNVRHDHIVLADVEESTFGVVVDKVTEVVHVPTEKIRKAPELVSTKISSEYIQGVVVIDPDAQDNGPIEKSHAKNETDSQEARIIILLDLPNLLQAKELLDVTSAVKDAAKKQTS